MRSNNDTEHKFVEVKPEPPFVPPIYKLADQPNQIRIRTGPDVAVLTPGVRTAEHDHNRHVLDQLTHRFFRASQAVTVGGDASEYYGEPEDVAEYMSAYEKLDEVLGVLAGNVVRFLGASNLPDGDLDTAARICLAAAHDQADQWEPEKGRAFHFFTTVMLHALRRHCQADKPAVKKSSRPTAESSAWGLPPVEEWRTVTVDRQAKGAMAISVNGIAVRVGDKAEEDHLFHKIYMYTVSGKMVAHGN